jgi:murE/murF fusion protein
MQSCAIEASSIGIAERRLDGTRMRVAVFTNFTQDHLDYHGSMQAYWAAKAELFDWPGLQAAVINMDDPARGRAGWQALDGARARLWTVSCTVPARLRGPDIGYGAHGLHLGAVRRRRAHALPPPGRRLQRIQPDGRAGAHARPGCALWPKRCAACGRSAARTWPHGRIGLARANRWWQSTMRTRPTRWTRRCRRCARWLRRAAGQLWCVFGCGGNRDATKRPLMAAVAEPPPTMWW